jgi:hypothetical protein
MGNYAMVTGVGLEGAVKESIQFESGSRAPELEVAQPQFAMREQSVLARSVDHIARPRSHGDISGEIGRHLGHDRGSERGSALLRPVGDHGVADRRPSACPARKRSDCSLIRQRELDTKSMPPRRNGRHRPTLPKPSLSKWNRPYTSSLELLRRLGAMRIRQGATRGSNVAMASRPSRGCNVAFTFDSVGLQGWLAPTVHLGGCDFAMIILGIVLLVIGFIAAVPIIWSIGVIVLLIGLVFMIFGALGHAIGGRRHIF